VIALHICFRDLGMRWPLKDHYDVEVWTSGHELIATLPGRLIRHLVELHLSGVVIQSEIQTLVRPLAKMAPRAILPLDRQRRTMLRQQRRSRREKT
jgi:hypothetical protein